MENQQSSSLFGLHLDENLKQSLKAAASMGGVAAIFGLVRAIVNAISGLMVRQTTSSYNFGTRTIESTRASNTGGVIGMVIGLTLAIFLFYYLNRFAKSTAAGVDSSSQVKINEGLGSLATYFKVIGVLLIIGVSLVLLGALIGIAGS